MPNRSVIFGAALFLVILIGLFFRPGSGRSRINDNQDFSLYIPPATGGHKSAILPEDILPPDEPLSQHDVELSEEQQLNALAEVLTKDHITISSQMSVSKKFWSLNFGKKDAFSPTLLPHPHPMKSDMWIMLGQEKRDETRIRKQVICEAMFDAKSDSMQCVGTPQRLPVATTTSQHCEGDYDAYNYEAGPHNAKAFFGPTRPYLIYGSPSSHNCMGQWMQDLTRLYYWQYAESTDKFEPFFQATDLARPSQYRNVERNWFAFWDRNDEMYLHYDIFPSRSFAKVNSTGGIGPELGKHAEASDQACMQQHLPQIRHPAYEKIQQASNALSITMCAKADDETCRETEQNTFIMTIFNVKTSFQHDVYEPHVMLFKRTAPFEIHAIGKKPLWINGREKMAGSVASGFNKAKNQMLTVNSMSFVKRDRTFHGYLDDPLYLSFSLDDEKAGAIDTTPGELLQELGTCT